MKAAGYKDIQEEDIPKIAIPSGGSVKVIAGVYSNHGNEIQGPIQGITTAPLFLDVHLPSDAEFEQRVPKELNAFVYVYEGELETGGPMRSVLKQAAIVLGDGDRLKAKAGSS